MRSQLATRYLSIYKIICVTQDGSLDSDVKAWAQIILPREYIEVKSSLEYSKVNILRGFQNKITIWKHMDELTHKTICKCLFSPWGFKAFLSATFVNILFLWPQLNEIKPFTFSAPKHFCTLSVQQRYDTSSKWRVAESGVVPQSACSPTAATKCQMTKTTLHYACDDNNNSVPDRGLWKSHLQLLNWKACSSNPEMSDWDIKETKRWREGGRREATA